MISISKNDIKSRAAKFAKDWEGVRSEKSEAQSFGKMSSLSPLGL